MERWHLLVVDDEPLNLELIAEYLDDPRYQLDLVPDAERALERLEASGPAIDLVVLDRTLPVMDGLDLLRRIKTEPRFQTIPVVMQTAAAAPDQVRAGIEAGAYYYLTKPYEPAALQTIVRSALADLADRRQAARATAARADALRLIEQGEFRFRTLEDVHGLAPLLASLCPVPEAAAMGLAELMINAIEHGNLGITYAEKTQLVREDRWATEIVRRLGLPEYRQRSARVTVRRGEGELLFTIADEGAGFDAAIYLEFDPTRAFDPNGRGIAMARQLCFDRLDYRGRGNVVEAAVVRPGGPTL